jgi:hypothetical protein
MGETEPDDDQTHHLLALGALFAAAAIAVSAPALPLLTGDAQAQSSSLKAADRALVERAGAYLNGLKSARGRFTQTDPTDA